jgi:hypothetical protein
MLNKRCFLIFLYCQIGSLLFAQNTFAQNKLIQKIEDAITGKSRSMVDSSKINLSNQIKTLQSFTGKRINSIVIEQHNLATSIDAKDSKLKDVFTKLGGALQSNTNKKQIKENLFFTNPDTCYGTSISRYRVTHKSQRAPEVKCEFP